VYEVYGVKSDSGKGPVPLTPYGSASTRRGEQALRRKAFMDDAKKVLVYFHGVMVCQQTQPGTL
jgi:ribulose-5-phosphate 4-epimerase/fuculose-1-phosphate aldolase